MVTSILLTLSFLDHSGKMIRIHILALRNFFIQDCALACVILTLKFTYSLASLQPLYCQLFNSFQILLFLASSSDISSNLDF